MLSNVFIYVTSFRLYITFSTIWKCFYGNIEKKEKKKSEETAKKASKLLPFHCYCKRHVFPHYLPLTLTTPHLLLILPNTQTQTHFSKTQTHTYMETLHKSLLFDITTHCFLAPHCASLWGLRISSL